MDENVPSPIAPSHPEPYSSPNNIPLLYYGLAIVATAAPILVVFNLVIIRCCKNNGLIRQPDRRVESSEPSSSRSFYNPSICLVSSFKYTREKGVGPGHDDGDHECPICLSVFEEGEEVRQMPKCKHSFHAHCIDIWLYSHVNCPVCRASLELPILQRNLATGQADVSQGRLVFTNIV